MSSNWLSQVDKSGSDDVFMLHQLHINQCSLKYNVYLIQKFTLEEEKKFIARTCPTYFNIFQSLKKSELRQDPPHITSFEGKIRAFITRLDRSCLLISVSYTNPLY